jgi:imidazole glycerol-phosphate synthase subunit HisH
MGTAVTVADYGSGNLFSVTRALERCGGEPVAAHDAAAIESAERLVLPGVGAFADGMQGLRERGLVAAIQRFATSGRPLLGICLGMQMLSTTSEEFGTHQGLGIIPGRVLPVPAHDVDGTPQRIPHIGWTSLHMPLSAKGWHGSLLEGTPEGAEVYLVHSFAVVPDDDNDRLADCDYGGHRLCAALRRGNVFGTQFHPEKSGPAGLAMLSTFLRRS